MFGFGKKAEEPGVAQDVPVAEAKAEGQNLKWGVMVGQMLPVELEKYIKLQNDGLEGGAKLWRLPTKDEFITEYMKTETTVTDDFMNSYWLDQIDFDSPSKNVRLVRDAF